MTRFLALASVLLYEPTELVRYCEDSFDGDEAELACLGQYR